jgi:hypothetical protein
MVRNILILITCLCAVSISAQTPKPGSPEYIVVETDTIPQGKMKFELYFAEWGGRMGNAPCEVIIEGKKITVQQTADTNLSGKKIIAQGILMKHQSGKWIIGTEPVDINAEEIGGCSDGPIPIDLNKKVIEWC